MGKYLIIKGTDFSAVKVEKVNIDEGVYIDVNVNIDGAGIVTGTGIYAIGSFVTISAVSNIGYAFVQWSDGNTDATRTIVVTEEKTYIAYFEESDLIQPIKISTYGWGYINNATDSIFEWGIRFWNPQYTSTIPTRLYIYDVSSIVGRYIKTKNASRGGHNSGYKYHNQAIISELEGLTLESFDTWASQQEAKLDFLQTETLAFTDDINGAVEEINVVPPNSKYLLITNNNIEIPEVTLYNE